MYASYLKYAGAEPFKPEEERDDISIREWEALTQDETYNRLAELRYIADKVEEDVHGDDLVKETHADEMVLEALDAAETAVDYYVAQWLATHNLEEVEV
ncbi:MAG: hypothetical protein ACOCUO_02105 [archaeon]